MGTLAVRLLAHNQSVAPVWQTLIIHTCTVCECTLSAQERGNSAEWEPSNQSRRSSRACEGMPCVLGSMSALIASVGRTPPDAHTSRPCCSHLSVRSCTRQRLETQREADEEQGNCKQTERWWGAFERGVQLVCSSRAQRCPRQGLSIGGTWAHMKMMKTAKTRSGPDIAMVEAVGR